jgi:hypothetical protein
MRSLQFFSVLFFHIDTMNRKRKIPASSESDETVDKKSKLVIGDNKVINHFTSTDPVLSKVIEEASSLTLVLCNLISQYSEKTFIVNKKMERIQEITIHAQLNMIKRVGNRFYALTKENLYSFTDEWSCEELDIDVVIQRMIPPHYTPRFIPTGFEIDKDLVFIGRGAGFIEVFQKQKEEFRYKQTIRLGQSSIKEYVVNIFKIENSNILIIPVNIDDMIVARSRMYVFEDQGTVDDRYKRISIADVVSKRILMKSVFRKKFILNLFGDNQIELCELNSEPTGYKVISSFSVPSIDRKSRMLRRDFVVYDILIIPRIESMEIMTMDDIYIVLAATRRSRYAPYQQIDDHRCVIVDSKGVEIMQLDWHFVDRIQSMCYYNGILIFSITTHSDDSCRDSSDKIVLYK